MRGGIIPFLVTLVVLVAAVTTIGPCKTNTCVTCNSTAACGTCNKTVSYSTVVSCIYGVCVRCLNNITTQLGPATGVNNSVSKWADVQVGVCTYFWDTLSSVTCSVVVASKATTTPAPTLSDGAIAGILVGMLVMTLVIVIIVNFVRLHFIRKRNLEDLKRQSETKPDE
jgi:hypothetical protein